MELTQTSFIQEKSLPIITFLGRPTDLKKGLTIFFEALEMLTSLSQIECFIVWIIGGDDDESIIVRNNLKLYPLLNAKFEHGSLIIWGRVENDALPELLSRSSVLVMPSYREQFGMVAVEAMQCGCPVIGARVGGLNDLIISQKTGFLFERGNSMALCSVLSGFLRNKPQRIKMRTNALKWGRHFSQKESFIAIKNLYEKNTEAIPNFWNLDYDNGAINDLVKITEELLKQKIINYKTLHYHGKHLSLKIETKSKQYFVKRIKDFPSCTISVFPIDLNQYPNPKSSQERFLRELFHNENTYSPNIIKYDIKNFILIMDYFDEVENNLLYETKIISDIISKIRSYKPVTKLEAINYNYYKILSKIRNNPSLELIKEFDRIVSIINQRITDKLSTFTRFHPQIELYRLKLMLKQNVWILPALTKSKFLEVIDYFLKNIEFNYDLPTLAHGDIKKEHFLVSGSSMLLCDWEHSKYCVGPLDEAMITFKLFYNQGKTINEALEYLGKIFLNNKYMFEQALSWLIAQVIFSSIYWYTQGEENSIIKGYDFLKNYYHNIDNLSENEPITP